MEKLKPRKKKITINIDEDILDWVRKKAGESDTPYQSLINRLLRQATNNNYLQASRLDNLEREVKALKSRIEQ